MTITTELVGPAFVGPSPIGPVLVGPVVVGVALAMLHEGVQRAGVRRRLLQRPSGLVPPSIGDAIVGADLGDPDRLVATWATTAMLLVGIGAVASPAIVVAGFGVAAAGPFALAVVRRRSARRRIGQLPVALESIASGLRGGAGLVQAIGAARVGDPLDAELASIVEDVDRGLGTDDALRRWRGARDDADTALAAGCLAVSNRVGGHAAHALDQAARSLRARQAIQAEARALATQSQLSAWVLVALPVLFTGLLAIGDADATAFLFGTPVGLACLAGGILLDATGAWWMHRIVAGARP